MIGSEVWAGGRLAVVPHVWRRRVDTLWRNRRAKADRLAEHEFSLARRFAIQDEADGWLVSVTDGIAALRVPVGASDHDICELAEKKARDCMDLAGSAWLKTPAAIRGRLALHVQHYGIKPPGEQIEAGGWYR